ncbi:MAG TPA: tetratricopeptide repeat protein [Verrucomicrobiae bacterium]|nr:tetratricopeptide repeat protein [Verrucomicrobiae bacterium]
MPALFCLSAFRQPVLRGIGAVGAAFLFLSEGHAVAKEATVTFNNEIAPLIFQHCAVCHRPGQAAPFSLLTYSDVKKHSKQILDFTRSGYMPPWLPEPEPRFGKFQNERRLSASEKELIQEWINQGTPLGEASALPPPSEFKGDWQLGKPDLVVNMSQPFPLGAEGPDVYRNFVIPLKLDRDRYVRAVEFSPGNPRIVHHAFIKVDATGACRRLEARDGRPGFDGMSVPAEMPDGQFLTWHPGELPSESPPGLPWRLPKESSLILQLHLNRSGKPEEIQSSVGLYFTDQLPTKSCIKLVLTSQVLDFPPGVSNSVITDSYKLPVDVQLLALLPHAHYLATEMQAFAELPDGQTAWLLRIKKWDFRWQGSYRYEEPVRLPKGSTVHLRYTYDNSANNIFNPNQPPKRVTYGAQSSDEMCELWLQLQTLPGEAQTLAKDHQGHLFGVFLEGAESRVRAFPDSAEAHARLGALLTGKDARRARQELAKAIELDSNCEMAHFELGVMYRSENDLQKAKRELQTVLRLNPENGPACGHLGFVFASLGQQKEAERLFHEALRLDPSDKIIQKLLADLAALERKRLANDHGPESYP